MMKRAWLTATVVVAAAFAPLAANAADPALNDTQKQGRRLFEQSCGVCHTKPTYLAPLYGPALHKESLSGQEEALQIVISEGTPRMPGFKFTFKPDEIKSIIAYLKTMPVPPPEAATEPAPRASRNVD